MRLAGARLILLLLAGAAGLMLLATPLAAIPLVVAVFGLGVFFGRP